MFHSAGVQYLLRELESHRRDCSESLGEDTAGAPSSPPGCCASPAPQSMPRGSPGLPSTFGRAHEKASLQHGCPGLAYTAAVKFRHRENWPSAAGRANSGLLSLSGGEVVRRGG